MLKAVRKHIPSLAPLCATQIVRERTVAVIQERGDGAASRRLCGKEASSVTFCLTLSSKMKELLDRMNSEKSVMGFISSADDFAVSAGEEDADLWWETSKSLKPFGFDTDQSCNTRREETEWEHSVLSFKEKIVVLGTGWNSTLLT